MQADRSLWERATWELQAARVALAGASVANRQDACDRLLAAERACTTLVHDHHSTAFELQKVEQPRLVLSLDVDGVLESQVAGFTSTSVAGAAALKLLQLGGVAVLLNTARFLDEVMERVE